MDFNQRLAVTPQRMRYVWGYIDESAGSDPSRTLPERPFPNGNPDRAPKNGPELEAGMTVRALSFIAGEHPETERIWHRLIRVAKQRNAAIHIRREIIDVAQDRLHGQP